MINARTAPELLSFKIANFHEKMLIQQKNPERVSRKVKTS